MDGHFVPNISFGYSILKDVSKVTNLFLDVHLMISEPQKYVDEFIKSGANLIVFHIETMENKEDTLALIHHIKEEKIIITIISLKLMVESTNQQGNNVKKQVLMFLLLEAMYLIVKIVHKGLLL